VKLLVVIVNYRVASLVVECLRSIETEIERSPGNDVQVAVCENGSGDDSADIIRMAVEKNGWSAWCRLKISGKNLGFTGGNNLLIRPEIGSRVPPTYVLLLNPDTLVRPGAFSALTDFMDGHPNVGIAGSRLEDSDGTPQRSAFRFSSPLGELERNIGFGPLSRLLKHWVIAPPVVDHQSRTDWVAGASMIVRREVFEKIGLLDEGFFTYFDDIDFCLNAAKSGWPTWYVPESRVVHLVGQSTGIDGTPKRLPAYLLEARRRYFLKNYGPIYAAAVDAATIIGIGLSNLRVFRGRKRDNMPPHLMRDSIRASVFWKGFRVSDVPPPSSI
jgi:GT2 family glycosyltransferase